MTKPTGRPNGRPSKYTKEIADFICKKLCQGFSLIKICNGTAELDDDEEYPPVPSFQTVFSWLREATLDKDKHPGFLEEFAHARTVQQEFKVEELGTITDDLSIYETKYGTQYDGAYVQAMKLKSDNTKWIAERLLSKKYGNKIQQEHSGEIRLKPVLEFVTEPKK